MRGGLTLARARLHLKLRCWATSAIMPGPAKLSASLAKSITSMAPRPMRAGACQRPRNSQILAMVVLAAIGCWHVVEWVAEAGVEPVAVGLRGSTRRGPE